MTAYRTYRDRDASLQLEKAFHFQWTPEDEQEGQDDLADLWDEMTPEERRDLVEWFERQREGESIPK